MSMYMGMATFCFWMVCIFTMSRKVTHVLSGLYSTRLDCSQYYLCFSVNVTRSAGHLVFFTKYIMFMTFF